MNRHHPLNPLLIHNPNYLPHVGPVIGPGFIPPFGLHRHSQLPPAVRAVLDKPLSYFKELASKKPEPFEQPLTHVAFALDKSSSMETGKAATIEGFNTQVNRVREGAKAAGATRYTSAQFGSGVEMQCVAAPLETLQPLTEQTYRPDGLTALYDALGMTIAALLTTEGIERASTAVLFTAFTDGGENYSSTYDLETLKALIERLEATGRWTFALVGPKGTVSQLAGSLSIRPANVAGYNPASVSERQAVFAAVANASTSYMSLRSQGVTQSEALYSGEPK